MAEIIIKVVEIVAPTYDELASKYSKCDDVGRALPPEIKGETKSNRCDN
jgi:hypothetical protein